MTVKKIFLIIGLKKTVTQVMIPYLLRSCQINELYQILNL